MAKYVKVVVPEPQQVFRMGAVTGSALHGIVAELCTDPLPMPAWDNSTAIRLLRDMASNGRKGSIRYVDNRFIQEASEEEAVFYRLGND